MNRFIKQFLLFLFLISLINCRNDKFTYDGIKQHIKDNSTLLYKALSIVDKESTSFFSITRFKDEEFYSIRVNYIPKFPSEDHIGFEFIFDGSKDSLLLKLEEKKSKILNTDLKIEEWKLLIETMEKLSISYFTKDKGGYTKLLIPNRGLSYFALIYKPNEYTFDVVFHKVEFKEEIERGLYLCKGIIN